MEERNDIVIYKSEDGLVKMEALVDPVNETIWASQKAIAALFDCTKQNVSYHMGKIFASGELERSTVVKEILTTAQSSARGLSEDKVLYYNLDAIISVGYRINSLRATKFRIWSTSIIKEYMRRGYVVNHNAVSEQKYEDQKKAVGLLENVFSKELLLTSDQATDLFDVIRDYTYALDTLDAYDYRSLKIADTTASERFFRNLLMGEDNALMNRYLHIKAKELLDGATPTSTPTSLIPGNENIKRLIEAIGENQLSVKEMLVAVGLKDRPNFLEYSLSPAMNEGYVRMLYPDSPRHPRQKYLLTVKGLAAYKEIKG